MALRKALRRAEHVPCGTIALAVSRDHGVPCKLKQRVEVRVAEFSYIDQRAITEGLTEQERQLFYLQYSSVERDRTVLLIVSVFAGSLGIDRFLLNDIGMGVLKLLTGGLCGILWVIDIFLIMGKTDEYNRQKAHEIVSAILANRAYMQQAQAQQAWAQQAQAQPPVYAPRIVPAAPATQPGEGIVRQDDEP